MKIQLQLTAFIVYFGSVFVHPYNENGYQLWKKTLQTGVQESQNVFNNMKDELQKAQNTNIRRKKNYSIEKQVEKRETNHQDPSSKNLAADDQEVSIATTSERDETKDQQGSTNSTNKPSFRKRNFMWKSKAVSKLQERHENAYEATTYRSKNVRTKPPPVSVDPLATDSEKRKLLNAHLLDLFGRNDTAKKEILDCEDAPNDMYGSCYISNYQTFMKHCYFAFSTSYRYGGLLYVKNLIARACKADWITTDEIKKILLDACSVRQRL